jgi:hypothetical protein
VNGFTTAAAFREGDDWRDGLLSEEMTTSWVEAIDNLEKVCGAFVCSHKDESSGSLENKELAP